MVVIGGGIAGLCAAIAARRLGASVLLTESAPMALRGGNARHARNFRIAHDAPLWHTPGAYPAAEFSAELAKISGDRPEETLAGALIEESAQVASWLMGCGVRLQAPDRGVLPYSRRTAFLLGGGKAMINALYATAARIGVAIAYDSEVLALTPTRDGGWEAEIATGGATRRLNARAVVLASGGPGADPAWRRAHFGGNADDILIRGSSYSNGRLMQRLVESGAQTVGDPSSCHMVAVDARGPAVDGGIVTRITAIPQGLVVDRHAGTVEIAGAAPGKSHYAQWGPRIAQCDGGLAFLILDADGVSRSLPTALAPIAAPTLETLADALALDGAALASSVAAFNQGARAIVRPPFSAFPMRAGLTFVHFGLAVDADMRVAENLFAAGMIATPNFFTRFYLAGLGLTLSAVTGRRAGEAAARALA
ncbi:FAD-binding dehydrogenase [Rhodoblastus sphagnicola]|uniref:FAD-binding dehydrogenase n=1 Tax=Rhodoblastus sphagnicola TaxID=333368 RepID=A0A2S6N914_9HYPH|nr:FAD-dependent tricarballylate dehydrogenase TcuA [Rhodoblastus sphagnicola]PPQ31099.1 FAD-binding dehydrogenase [Rhodoblastus sphagnicola]